MNRVRPAQRVVIPIWSALMLPFALMGLICGCATTPAGDETPPLLRPVGAAIAVASLPILVPIAAAQGKASSITIIPKRPKPGDPPPPGSVLIYKAGDPTVSNSAPKALEP